MNRIPLLLLFDLASALSSVEFQWCNMVLRGLKLATGLRRAVESLCADSQAYHGCSGGLNWPGVLCDLIIFAGVAALWLSSCDVL